MQTLSVSALNEQIKNLLETTFVRTYVEGELSRITYHNSGHIYFSIKDSGSSLKCVMFRGNAAKLRFKLEEGLKVVIDGAITLYKPRGEYQLNCHMIEPSGHGALALAYEQLKSELQANGFFEQERKKAMPKLINKMALITSETGAALQDMLRVAQNRWPLVEITIFDVLVQGDSAKYSIVDAINYADTKEFDVLVVARGGGSKEDLWAFNERIVAESIFEAKTPVVSAVGHEIDTLISDYVADLRAPTPSAAMEMLLPDKNEMLMMLDSISSQYNHVFSQQLHHHKKVLIQLEAGYKRNSIEQKIKNNFDVINEFKQQLRTQVLHKIEMKKRELLPLHDTFSRHLKSVVQNKSYYLQQLQNSYELNKPSNKNKKGFVQISKESELIKLENLKKDDRIVLMDSEFKAEAQILSRKKYK